VHRGDNDHDDDLDVCAGEHDDLAVVDDHEYQRFVVDGAGADAQAVGAAALVAAWAEVWAERLGFG
jgi:hypothetical protein